MNILAIRFRLYSALLVSLIFICNFYQIAHAQFDSATILGTVSDSSGAAVQGATILLKNTETGTTANAQTDENGSYQFLNVKIGNYQITAEAEGFTPARVEAVEATVNARQRIDIELRTGAVTETVVVTDTAALLETDSSERGQVITREQIVNLPLNGRAYADLALLAPGVRRSLLNNNSSGGRDASFNVNGLRSSLNNFILDGVDNNSYGTSNQGFSNQVVQPSPDAVAEFKVQTNNYSAEFGRAGGAVINTSIRSGTNRFSGTVYDFVRNTALNATGFFKPRSGEKPTLIQNQFGGTFGGPVRLPKLYDGRDRTFFFIDYEGFRRITKELNFSLVPTLEQRNGVFRDAQGRAIPIRNPYTNAVYTDGIIPSNQITNFATQVFSQLPAPNRTIGTLGITENYEFLPRSQFFNDKGDIKLDHTFSERATAFVRGSLRKVNNFEAPAIPLPLGSPANANVRVINEQIAGGFTFTVTPTSVLEARLGISRTKAGKTPPGIGGATIFDLYGIAGLPTDASFAGGLNTQSIGGYRELGRQSSNPQFQNPTIINPRFNYSFLVNRHSLKTGYEYQAINTDIEDFNPKYGQDTYGGQFSRPIGATANNIYNVADFLFGARSRYQLANLFVAQYRQRMHFAYLQDDFKVNNRLTLNLGLRYDFATPQYEAQNRLSNFDPATNSLIQARDGSLYDRALVDPDKNNFAPRLGFAYNLASRVVLRGGYGISYVHFNRLGGENILSFNGPQIIGATIDQNAAQLAQGICTGNNFLNCFRPTTAGYPSGLVDPANFSTLTARVNYTPRDTPTASVQSFHGSIQYEFVRNFLVDVAYVGNRSRNLIVLADYNQVVPDANGLYPTTGTLLARRPISGYNFIQASFAGGRASYDSLQIKLERRFTGGLYLLNSFTFSKSIDNASGHLETAFGDNSRLNIRNLAAEKGLSGYDQPVNNTTSIVYDVPFGRGRRFGADIPRALDYLIGNFRLTLINVATSGQIANLTYSPVSAALVGDSLTYRPNVIGDVRATAEQRANGIYLNRSAIAIPSASQPFGNAGRNTVRGPAFFQSDVGVIKSFPLFNENTRLEFRVEAFNLFNHTNFGAPNTNVSNSNFGTITTAFPAREIQFALKLNF